MLHIDLTREVPEALKPRRIEIAAGGKKDANLVDAKSVN
jgi:molecular chaperone IbpA